MPEIELMIMQGSQYSMKAMAALQHKGLAYKLRKISPPRLKKDVPGGKVPVMLWNGEVVKDSTDIMRFLDRQIPEKPLFPAGNQDVAQLEEHLDEEFNRYPVYYRWIDNEGFQRSMKPALQSFLPPILRSILPPLIKRGLRKRFDERFLMTPDQAHAGLMKELGQLDERLATRTYLCGEEPTAADFAAYGMLAALIDVYGPCPQALADAKATRLQAWYRRMQAEFPLSFS